MRRLLITLDDKNDLWLSKQPNQSEAIRKALTLYNGDITTDTVQGLRQAFMQLQDQQQELTKLVNYAIEQLEALQTTINSFKQY